MLDGLDWNERTNMRIHIHIIFAAREGIVVTLVDRVQGSSTMDTKACLCTILTIVVVVCLHCMPSTRISPDAKTARCLSSVCWVSL